MEQHRDEHITCADCGTTFVFSAAEAESFASKKLEPPKRCFECRKARRAQKNAGRDEQPPRGQFGGDVNGYRSPMSDPAWSRSGRDSEYRAPGFRDSRGNSSAGDFVAMRFTAAGAADATFGQQGLVVTPMAAGTLGDLAHTLVLQADDRLPAVRAIQAGEANGANNDFAITRYWL